VRQTNYTASVVPSASASVPGMEDIKAKLAQNIGGIVTDTNI
jgi:hypothetical protein